MNNDRRYRAHGRLIVIVTLALAAGLANRTDADDRPANAANTAIGARGSVGCGPQSRVVQRLAITAPRVYENSLVDGEWTDKYASRSTPIAGDWEPLLGGVFAYDLPGIGT